MVKRNLFFIFFLLICSSYSIQGQSVLDQSIQLNLPPSSPADILYHLIDEQGIKMVFSNDLLSDEIITIPTYPMSIRQLLDLLFDYSYINYKEIGDRIVLFKRSGEEAVFYTISGFLKDKKSGEPLIYTNVYDRMSRKGTYTNEYGFYSITLPSDSVEIVYSYLGYASVEEKFFLHKSRRLNIEMYPHLTLKEVVISEKNQPIIQTIDPTVDYIDLKNIRYLPGSAGEQDPVSAIRLLAGVTSGADGFGGNYVRGGNAGQNRVLIDGIPIYYLSHAGGMFSIINPDAIRSIKLYKGGFSSKHGESLSSVLDIRTKEGNLWETKGSLSLGLLTTNASLEGPIVKGKSSYLVTARKSYANVYIKPYSTRLKDRNGEDGQSAYQFYDLNAKVNYNISERDKVFLSLYTGKDDFDDESRKNEYFLISENSQLSLLGYDQQVTQGLDWKNHLGALRWNHLFSDKLFANTTLTFSRLNANYTYFYSDSLYYTDPQQLVGSLALGYNYFSGIDDYGAKIDFDLAPKANHLVQFGIDIRKRLFTPGIFTLNELPHESYSGNLITASSYVAWAERRIYKGDNFFKMGLRANVHNVNRTNYRYWEANLLYRRALDKNWLASLSYNRSYQFLHLLSNSNIGLPIDLWVPSTKKIQPEYADQFVASLNYKEAPFQLQLEIYYKKMQNLLAFSEGATLLNDWQDNVTPGQGASYGIEWSSILETKKIYLAANYTYAHTNREFEKINFGRIYPFKYDRRHNLKLAGVFHFNDKWSAGATWIYVTGVAFSLPLVKYNFSLTDYLNTSTTTLFDYGTKNQYRLPTYHRLDLSINYKKTSGRIEHYLQLGVNNLYDRKNPLYYQFRTYYVSQEQTLSQINSFIQVTLVPLMPSIHYSIRF